MIDHPILSIAIPTYNRPKQLQNLLNSISDQYSQDLRLEIVISDNSPGTETADLVSTYTELPILYIHQERNIGGARNFLFVVDNSRGSYCWIIGDDDLVLPGSIREILSVLSSSSGIECIVLGYAYVHDDYRSSIVTEPSSAAAEYGHSVFADTSINHFIDKWEDTFYLAHLPGLHTSILSCVFCVKSWRQHIIHVSNELPNSLTPIPDEFTRLSFTFPHASTWGRMFIGRPIYLISKPMVALFYGAQDWISKWPVIMFTRCLDLADFYASLGASSRAVQYYKNLILADSSLRYLLSSSDSYTAKNFNLSRLVVANAGSSALWKNIQSFLGDNTVSIKAKLKVGKELLRPAVALKILYIRLRIAMSSV